MKLSKWQEKEILLRAKNGESALAMAPKVGCDQSTISKFLRERRAAGVKYAKTPWTRTTAEQHEKIHALRRAGKTSEQIHLFTGISMDRIRSALRRTTPVTRRSTSLKRRKVDAIHQLLKSHNGKKANKRSYGDVLNAIAEIVGEKKAA